MNVEREGTLKSLLADGACNLCKRVWWTFLIGGIASVAFGILAFFNPGVALFVLGLYLAAYLIVDGGVNVWGAVTNREKDGWWTILLLGLLSVAVGIYALLVPAASMLAIVYMAAFIAMLIGVSSLMLGWRIRKEVSSEWLLYVTGVLSVLFSLLILFRPGVGGTTVVYLIATWAIVIGALRIFFAFHVRKLGSNIESRAEASA
jgi:uncharacterized membrane protein HdeD (DUF308 family)